MKRKLETGNLKPETGKLRPCPFCGSHPDTDTVHQKKGLIRCHACNAAILRLSNAAAAKAWNQRGADFSYRDLLESCKTFTEKSQLARILKEASIIKQDFTSAVFYRDDQKRFELAAIHPSQKGTQS